MNIGKNITYLRKAKKMTQEELANSIRVSPKTISSYENNRSIPSIDILILLANTLETDIDTILGLTNETAKDLNKIYEKTQFKNAMINFIALALIMIVPIAFFWYAGYISIAAFSAQFIENANVSITYAATTALVILNMFTIEYVVYLIIVAINYCLYKKKYSMPLFAINIVVLLIAMYNFITSSCAAMEILVFIFASLLGLVMAFKINKLKKLQNLKK